MNVDEISDADLEAYLDEALPPDEMAAIEDRLRSHPELTSRLVNIHGRRDAGIHTLGEIWRRYRVSCPTREELGNYLLQVLEAEPSAYIRFHLETVCCRLCNANYEDMQLRQKESSDSTAVRRRKYFHSSAGYLPGK